MKRQVFFESVGCEDLQYVKASNSWVCLRRLCDLRYADECYQCKFADLRAKEDKIRKEKRRG